MSRSLAQLRRLPAATLALALVAGCGRDARPATIAAVGWWDSTNQSGRRGIELAAEELARAKAPVRVAFYEDHRDADSAIAIAQRLVDDPTVLGVIGHTNSNPTLAAVKIYDGRLPLVSPWVVSPDFPAISPWMFRLNATDSVYAAELVRLADRQGWRRAAVLFDNTSGGRAFAAQFKRQFPGQVISMDPIGWDTAAAAVEPFISFYRARRPDVVFHAGNTLVGRHFVREARRQGLQAAWMGPYAYLGMAAEGPAAEGVFAEAAFDAGSTLPRARRFVAAYRNRWGTEPDADAALGYDAVMLLADRAAHGAATPRQMRDALASLGGGFAGVTGAVRFTGDGDRVAPSVVAVQARGGRWRVVEGR